MTEYLVARPSLLDWLRALSKESTVYFPQQTGTRSYAFEPIREHSVVEFETAPSPVPRKEFRASSNMAPPGKRLAPFREELFRFHRNDHGEMEITPSLNDEFQILAGVRPCDLKAIYLLDLVNGEGAGDPYYLTRRVNTAIIAHDCLQPCDDRCFCDATGSLRTREGADIFLTPLESDILLECLTDKGCELARDRGFTPCDNADAIKAWAESQRAKPFGRQLKASVEQLPGILQQQWNSPVWQKHVERCFSCGTCNLVCPTCYCFDVHDDIELENTTAGVRYRTCDSCMLPEFSAVAGGHNFRPQAMARQRHRVKRKFEYQERFGAGSFCVGCGRCGHQCTVGIDIFDIVNDLVAEAEVSA